MNLPDSVNSSEIQTPHRAGPALTESVVGSILLCALAFWTQGNYGFNWADEGYLWYGAQRAALGDVPILDFASYAPGRYYWSAMFFNLTGNNGLFDLLFSNAMFGAIGLAAMWFSMCRAGIDWRWRFVAAILIIIALGYPRHKVFEQSLSLIAVSAVFFVFLKPGCFKRWLSFGVLTGLAAFMGRNHGVYFLASALLCSGFLLFTSREALKARSFAWFCAGVIIGYSPMLIMLATIPGMFEAYAPGVLSTTGNAYMRIPIPYPWTLDLTGQLALDEVHLIALGIVCMAVPLLYVWSLILTVIKSNRAAMISPVILLLCASAVVGLPYLHHAYDRSDWGHISQSILPAFPAMIAASYFAWHQLQWRKSAMTMLVIFSLLFMACWLPHQPGIQYARLQNQYPGFVSAISFDDKDFSVLRPQAHLLSYVKKVLDACQVGPNEFMAAPFFPGIYAFFEMKAPTRTTYYLFDRSVEQQEADFAAMDETRLIMIATEDTIDGNENFKFSNTNKRLMQLIQGQYVELKIHGLPHGIKFYARPGACG